MSTSYPTGSGRMRFAGPPGVPCVPLPLTPAGFYPALSSLFPFIANGYNGGDFPSDGVTYYLKPGMGMPLEPTPGAGCQWGFPARPPPAWYRRSTPAMPGGFADFAQSFALNFARIIVVGDGQLTVYFGDSQFPAGHLGPRARVIADGVTVFNQRPIASVASGGEAVTVALTGSSAGNCIHIVDTAFTEAATFFGWAGALWVPDYDPEAPPETPERVAMRGSGAAGTPVVA